MSPHCWILPLCILLLPLDTHTSHRPIHPYSTTDTQSFTTKLGGGSGCVRWERRVGMSMPDGVVVLPSYLCRCGRCGVGADSPHLHHTAHHPRPRHTPAAASNLIACLLGRGKPRRHPTPSSSPSPLPLLSTHTLTTTGPRHSSFPFPARLEEPWPPPSTGL